MLRGEKRQQDPGEDTTEEKREQAVREMTRGGGKDTTEEEREQAVREMTRGGGEDTAEEEREQAVRESTRGGREDTEKEQAVREMMRGGGGDTAEEEKEQAVREIMRGNKLCQKADSQWQTAEEVREKEQSLEKKKGYRKQLEVNARSPKCTESLCCHRSARKWIQCENCDKCIMCGC